MTQRSQILESGVTEEQLSNLETAFINQFQTVLTNYNITVSGEEISIVGLPILFEVILDLGASEAVEDSVSESVEVLLEEFGTKSGRNNILFLSGRIATEASETELADASRELYGKIKQKEMEGL